MCKQLLVVLLFLLCIPRLQAQYAFGDTISLPQLQQFGGDTINRADLIGTKPLVIVCWASWNGASRSLMDDVGELYESLNPMKKTGREMNFDVVDISIDTRQDLYTTYLKREAFPWKYHVNDLQGWESDVITQLNIRKVPTIWVIDRRGIVVAVDVDRKQLRQTLNLLME